MPVSSFAPEFIELYKAAAQQDVEIKGLTASQAIHFRSRMHRLRVEMRKESHPAVALADRVIISIDPSPHKDELPEGQLFTVICRPPDVDFVEKVREAGITVPPPTEVPDLPAAPPQKPSADASEAAAAVYAFLNKEIPSDDKSS